MAYHFNLPKLDELTNEQQAVLKELSAISISGGPGTGKSVVSLWRHIRNHSTGQKNSLLLTYTKTLEVYLSATVRVQNSAAANSVDRTYRWINSNSKSYYDEIIIDEAQDVSSHNYQVVSRYANQVSYGADENQILYPDKCSTEKELMNIFPSNTRYKLHSNFRNTFQIVQFIRGLFPNRLIPQSTIERLQKEGRNGNKPTLLLTHNRVNAIKEVIEAYHSSTHNIAILVPFGNQVDEIFNEVESLGAKCSKYHSKIGRISEISNIHITTFKSSKGTEFDTVIIPDFDGYQYNINNMRMVDENDYYVAITRARRNLYLISPSSLNFIPSSTYNIEKL